MYHIYTNVARLYLRAICECCNPLRPDWHYQATLEDAWDMWDNRHWYK